MKHDPRENSSPNSQYVHHKKSPIRVDDFLEADPTNSTGKSAKHNLNFNNSSPVNSHEYVSGTGSEKNEAKNSATKNFAISNRKTSEGKSSDSNNKRMTGSVDEEENGKKIVAGIGSEASDGALRVESSSETTDEEDQTTTDETDEDDYSVFDADSPKQKGGKGKPTKLSQDRKTNARSEEENEENETGGTRKLKKSAFTVSRGEDKNSNSANSLSSSHSENTAVKSSGTTNEDDRPTGNDRPTGKFWKRILRVFSYENSCFS